MVGPNCCVDPEKDFVVCVNIFGSAYGTTGPRSIADPLAFPRFTVRDTARLFSLVREHLGIEQIDLLVGSSIGGFHALEWAIMEGERILNAAFIATAPRVSAWLSAWMEVQRMAIEADPTFRACENLDGGRKGLEAARAISLISYRSFDGYNLTQYETDDDCLFASRAASYERYQGEKLVKRGFDAYSYYYLLYCVDSQNVGRNRGGVAIALSQIKAKSIVIAITSDGLFPPAESSIWAQHIPNAQYYEIESRFGHDGFLLETEQITRILGSLEYKD
jgi:homoserine O-acetyltransferase